jgi:hypothetical protein
MQAANKIQRRTSVALREREKEVGLHGHVDDKIGRLGTLLLLLLLVSTLVICCNRGTDDKNRAQERPGVRVYKRVSVRE